MINKQILEHLHLHENKSIYEIADILHTEHKIIRAYFNQYDIAYQFYSTEKIFSKSYPEPQKEILLSKLSIIAHSLYLCEGYHTKKTNRLFFVNTDPELIKIFTNCIHSIYQYNKPVSLQIAYNFECKESEKQCQNIISIFNDAKKYSLSFYNDKDRKKTIIKLGCGGKNFARLFIDNAYYILNQSI